MPEVCPDLQERLEHDPSGELWPTGIISRVLSTKWDREGEREYIKLYFELATVSQEKAAGCSGA